MTEEWIMHNRKGGTMPEAKSLVSIRPAAIAFNAHFVKTAEIDRNSFVSIRIKPDSFQVGFKFHNDSKIENSYTLSHDGGGSRRGRGRSIQITSLLRENPWLKAVSLEPDQRLRRFEPKWISADSLWVISVSPSFEIRVSDKSDIPSDISGIYRYKREDEIVYIGRGQVRSRTQAFGREDWDFDTIEYSVVNEADQEKWESFWLDHFFRQHAKLPIYNRIAGKKI
jgi:hypothetical protein